MRLTNIRHTGYCHTATALLLTLGLLVTSPVNTVEAHHPIYARVKSPPDPDLFYMEHSHYAYCSEGPGSQYREWQALHGTYRLVARDEDATWVQIDPTELANPPTLNVFERNPECWVARGKLRLVYQTKWEEFWGINLISHLPYRLPPIPVARPTPIVRDSYASSQTTTGCPLGCTNQKPGCDIKGNISYESGERIYHVPGQKYYVQTKIDVRYGERWFCTDGEAIINGWRKSKR